MKEGWKYKKLGEVCNVLNGYAFKSKHYGNEGVRIIRITNVQKGYVVDENPKYYSAEDFVGLNQYVLNEGDLVMSLTGNVGRVGILSKKMIPAALNQRVACIRLKGDEIDKRYLFHYLNSDIFEQNAIMSARGIAQKNMSTEWLKCYEIKIPPKATQLDIVAELDQINDLVRLKKEQLKEYDNLAQSIFYDMFGDPVENEKYPLFELEKVTSNIVDCPHSTPIKSKFPTEYPCIRTSELKGGSIKWETMQYVNQEEYEKRISRLVPMPNDIIYGREGTIGDAVLLPYGYHFCLGQRTMLVRANEQLVIPIYLHRALISNWVLHQAKSKNVASTVAHVNVKDFKKFTIPLPPLPLQQEFSSRIEQIEKLKTEVQKTITDLETLLASRMQYWFE